jgi:hypothetical protein
MTQGAKIVALNQPDFSLLCGRDFKKLIVNI